VAREKAVVPAGSRRSRQQTTASASKIKPLIALPHPGVTRTSNSDPAPPVYCR
jgi:hypothetical protein